jgi:triacylglycerol esterase/lipase EstA (alpha/beta hydrolase family)
VPSTAFARGGLRVTHPSSYAARQAQPGRGERALPGLPDMAGEGDPSSEPLLDALQDKGFRKVEWVELTPAVSRDAGRAPRPVRRGKVSIDVDLLANEDAVVLLDQDGYYTWQLPLRDSSGPEERSRDLGGGPRTAHFEFAVAPARPSSARPDRSLLTGLPTGAVRAFVLRFAAPALTRAAIRRLEAHVHTGLVRLTSLDSSAWTPVEDLGTIRLPGRRTPRILLFVHGTFSSTVGGFAALAGSAAGAAFLRRALDIYDAVLGYDHRTLSVDPLANAKEIAGVLVGLSGRPAKVDIVCHSRGGLTTRSLLEEVLPGSGWRGSVDRVVFVAATNGGTHLADAKRWTELVNLYTNLVAASARVAGVLGGAPVGLVVGEVVAGLGALVKYLASYAVTQEGVPGLAAMSPDSRFVREINESQRDQPRAPTPWFVVSSNFHVELFGDRHEPPEFPRALVERLKEGAVDQIFEADNDLVVDTASMSAIDLPGGGGFVRDTLAFGTNPRVYHNNYFNQPETAAALTDWLLERLDTHTLVELSRDLPPHPTHAKPPAPAPPPPAVAPPDFPEGDLPLDRDLPPRGVAANGGGPSRRPGEIGDRVPVSTPADEDEIPRAQAFLRAQMPKRAAVGEETTVRVRLSRKEIEAEVGTVADVATLLVAADRPLRVQVVPKRNVVVSGVDTDQVALPAGGGTSEVTFTIVPTHAGPFAVTVLVREGFTPMASMRLEGEAASSTRRASRTVATADVEMRGQRVEALEQVPWLEIHESERGGDTVFTYLIRSASLDLLDTYESPPLRDRAGFVADLFRQVEQGWVDHSSQPKVFLQRLQDIGSSLFEELFPEELQAVLWKNRNKLQQMILIADEPYIPWELVHLKPPKGPRQAKPLFLGQLGLVRWQPVGWPRSTLRARHGRVFALCPTYLDPALADTDTSAERDFLTTKLSASFLKGERDLRSLLRRGDFDLLHFAGHGLAEGSDIASAKIVLGGRRTRQGQVVAQYLTSTAVAENARLRQGDGDGPLVVLNACQLGRGGQQLSTLGGFAKAFLSAGATAFVSSVWSIGDRPATEFVTAFYSGLLDGKTVGEAAVAARERARTAGDATWLAYVVYARPDARLNTA